MSMVPQNETIARLLAEAGLRGEFACVPLPGGGNNRVFRIECDGQSILLKAYFQHPTDPRDRLQAEFSFCRFGWDHGVRRLPRPIASDRATGLGLYEFVAGRALSPGEIGNSEVEQALDFYQALNRHKNTAAARELACGSEACFTLSEHLACVERRVMSLEGIDATAPGHAPAAELIRDRLAPAWRRIKLSFLRQAADHGLPVDQTLAYEDRCLSPSDFGFHNAILATDGQLRFIDFEYAGWDDPAKLVCDFFAQPAVPAPAACLEPFVNRVTSQLSNPPQHARRIELLRPVYLLKWCCIMLNEFLPTGRKRRTFAREPQNEAQLQQTQLQKARSVLDDLQLSGA
jgi:hypothetical protein